MQKQITFICINKYQKSKHFFTVILSFLKLERDFAIVSDRSTLLTIPERPTFLTVSERFMTVSELFCLQKTTNGEKRSRNAQRSGTVNGCNA
jgi:hypothetical protein